MLFVKNLTNPVKIKKNKKILNLDAHTSIIIILNLVDNM